MAKLTPTMLLGLRKMEAKLRRQSEVLAEPNDNTGRALMKRGLLEAVEVKNGWQYYRITEAGLAALKDTPSHV